MRSTFMIARSSRYASPLRRPTPRDFKRAAKGEPSHDAPSVRDRIKVGDLVNHHGFLGIVTKKEDHVFVFETLEDGKPNGEVFSFPYDDLAKPRPTPCWTTE
jgi:hypothetical protein